MTKKGLLKLLTKPHIFLKDYMKKKKSKEELKRLIEKAINLNIPSDLYYYKIFKELKKEKGSFLAEEALKKAIEKKAKAIYYYELALLLKRKSQWWQIVDALEKAIEIDSLSYFNWYKFYVDSLIKMKRYEKVIEVFKALEKNKTLDADDYFIFGDVLRKEQKEAQAEEVFKKAIVLDEKKNSKEFGIGIFYEKKGQWKEASINYQKTLVEQPFNPNIYYKLALSLDRIYEWDKAEEVYLKAVLLKPKNIDWYYRIGFVRERQEKYLLASEAYRYAANNRQSHTPYWYYRLGYVLNKAQEYKQSCEAFLMMKKIRLEDDLQKTTSEEEYSTFLSSIKDNSMLLSLDSYVQKDTTNTEAWHKLANIYFDFEMWEKSEQVYKELIIRKDSFDQELYFKLAYVLTLQGKYKEASEAFIEQRILQSAHGVLENPYNKNQKLKEIINYTEYYERYDLDKNCIMYESYHGSSMSCNPYAIFKSLLADERFKSYKHIWVINDKEKIADEFKNDINIIFIKRNCDLYMRYLAKAKYLINNVTFPEYFIRKEGQIYLNTWHGTPIKSLGKDIKDEFMAHKNVTRNFLQASHLIQPNQYTTDILLNRYDVKDIISGIVAKTGYPRQDLMLNISKEEKNELKRRLNISSSDKVVLYAPTWRGEHGSAVFNTEKLKEDIQHLTSIDNTHLLFRGHHMIESLLEDLDSELVVPSEIETNTLLSIVDVLITDYSSIAFDYMALEKPIIYYAYDREEYEGERGFYFPLEELGGKICKNSEELLVSLTNVIINTEIMDKQKEAQKRFCSYDEGSATKKVIDLVFMDKKENIDIVEINNKKSILLYGGQFMSNGITTSFINLLNHIDLNTYNISVCIDPNNIKNNDVYLKEFEKLNGRFNVIPRVGQALMTLEEKWIRDKLESQDQLSNHKMWVLYQKLFEREYLRIFGRINFNSVIHFEGYNKFWESIFAFSPKSLVNVKSIYQHNDMNGEWKLKYPKLKINFQLYKEFKHIVSVSQQTKELNKNNLSNLFSLNKEQFIYCDNVQNPEYSLLKAEEAIENKADENIFQDSKVFINIARLSPEKDQEKLIKAFKQVSILHPEAKLINLGSGVLENHLKSLVKGLALEDKVYLLGQRFNPYSYLKKSDCFILSSNHEGQPMTLLEALILKKPIIATDIVGNRSVLEGRPGLLVENSEEGLVQGMLDFLEGQYIEKKTFDYEVYNRNALNMFYEKVVNYG